MSTVLRKRVDPKPKKLGATRLSQMEDKENKPPMAAAKCKQGECHAARGTSSRPPGLLLTICVPPSVAEVCTPPQREALRPRQVSSPLPLPSSLGLEPRPRARA